MLSAWRELYILFSHVTETRFKPNFQRCLVSAIPNPLVLEVECLNPIPNPSRQVNVLVEPISHFIEMLNDLVLKPLRNEQCQYSRQGSSGDIN